MTLETSKFNIEETTLQDLLSKTHKEELNEILAIGEKYKEEGEEMRDNFWKEHKKDEFKNLLGGFEESVSKFIEGLEPEEKRIINKLNEIEKKKFLNEYLNDRILYSGDLEKQYEIVEIVYNRVKHPDLKERAKELKDNLKLGMSIDLYAEKIGDEGVEMLTKEWKDSLQPGMHIDLSDNEIGSDGAIMLVREWKDKLQPGMEINLSTNNIGLEGAVVLAKERKGVLQQGMWIILGNNEIGSDGAIMLAREWKDKLQPGMTISLQGNKIGDEGVEILAKEWKNSLQPGMSISLNYNNIGDKGVDEIMKLDLKDGVKIYLYNNGISSNKKKEIEKWVQGYKDRGINCEVTL